MWFFRRRRAKNHKKYSPSRFWEGGGGGDARKCYPIFGNMNNAASRRKMFKGSLCTINSTDDILQWCASVLGPCEIVSDPSREHPGQRASIYRLRTPAGNCCVKYHRDLAHWESEVHAYEQWAPAFGAFAPRLLAVRAEEPLALIISELPGEVLEDARVSPSAEIEIWRSAGQALARLHNFKEGEFFGRCHRDGSPAETPILEAQEYIRTEFENWMERGARGGYLQVNEWAIARAAQSLIPAFAGERPVPCHRDYCPANWLVQGGAFSGVIDFEFSGWDVRSADFTRFPSFDWIGKPELMEAFFEGYGRVFSAAEEQQRLVSRVLYALGALVWGSENQYNIYAGEGRQALLHLGSALA